MLKRSPSPPIPERAAATNVCSRQLSARWFAGVFSLGLLLSPLLPIPVLADEGDLSTAEEAFLRMYAGEEEVVEAPTRHPKPLSEVAENVTIITARQIRDMNAHTLAEVLNRVTGVFVDSFGANFGSLSLVSIQGSREEHVTVLVDGIPWNMFSGGAAGTVTVPVEIIDRVEVIKGPASSAWGSSLGGVVNVITKTPGKNTSPDGMVSAAYGERNTVDARAEVTGATGTLGYYGYGGYQSAEWQHNGGEFHNKDGFAKLSFPFSPDLHFGLSAGFADAEPETGRLVSQGALVDESLTVQFANVSLDAALSRHLGIHISTYALDQRLQGSSTEDGSFGPAGDLLRETVYDERTYGLRSRLVWRLKNHTLVSGFDYDHGRLEQRADSGAYFQSLGAPARFTTNPSLSRWGLYINDSFTYAGWSLTPGLRLDDTTKTEVFWSPSLGATRKLGARTVLRVLSARGFSTPPLSDLSGGGANLDANPDLEPEKVWSFQAGIETKSVPFLWLKGTLFHHRVNDLRVVVPSAATPGNVTVENGGRAPRTGLEAELETAPILNTSLRGGITYVRAEQPAGLRDTDQYAADLSLHYQQQDSLYAELSGHFIWWDLGPGYKEGEHNDWIWSFNAWKRFHVRNGNASELFLTIHNLLNGKQYTDPDRGNPDRWLEGGIRIRF